MALADRTPASTIRGSKCTVCKLITTLNDDDAQTLKDWLASPVDEVHHAAIHRELVDEFPDNDIPTAVTIGRHRRGECRGPR